MANRAIQWTAVTLLLLGVCASAVSDSDAPALPPGLDGGQDPAESAPDEGPSLPAGLDGGESEGPSLPSGLGDDDDDDEAGPSLPAGLDEPPEEQEPGEPGADLPDWLDFTGFWEVRGGVWTQKTPHRRDASVGETRLQLETEHRVGEVKLKLRTDLLYDAVYDEHAVDLRRGDGWLDLRQASARFTPLEFMDVEIGRQVLTWGTGDLVFLNDLFPKDWVSFLIGRDVEYLKAPTDAVKMSVFTDAANADLVYVPVFTPDRFITGERVSYYNALLGRRAARNAVLDPDVPNEWFDDQEFAARVYRNVRGYELAAYGYWGYWKSPGGFDRADFDPIFPRLSVYGASARGQVLRGIGNVEVAYYDSRQDRDGDDPFVNNSQMRYLVGYEQDLKEIAHDLTVGAQYYVEQMMEYDAYRRTLPPGIPPADRCRQVVTVRVTKLMMNQNLTLSLFTFYSPTDQDAYLRPLVSYKIDDHWTVSVGGNVFVGNEPHTFFGQFERNSNVYASLRYGF